jgi:superfamily II DNA or RNA helicase
VPFESASAPTSGTSKFLPRLRLFVERILVEGDKGDEEREWPVISLVFDYAGTRLRSNDQRERFFISTETGSVAVQRDRQAERRVQCLLESFGAVELEQVEQLLPPLDTEADYLVQVSDNVHAYCSFTAFALPQLVELGCAVTIDPDYPYQVVDDDPPWKLSIEPELGQIDWFSLELGIDADGRRVDILPAILAIIDERGKGETLDSLLRLPAKRRAIAVGPNRYVTLLPERFRALLQVILELYRGDRTQAGALRVGRVQAASLARLEQIVSTGGAQVPAKGASAIIERGHRLLTEISVHEQSASVELTATLRSYQAQGLAWLERLRELGLAGVLADDMGLGKTLQTIALLASELAAGRMDRPSVVVVPTSLLVNWVREIERFCPALTVVPYHGCRRSDSFDAMACAHVIVTTYPVLVRDLPKLSCREYHYLILDEAQAIKNSRSLTAQAAKSLTARHRLCLSGTPVENNLDELWSLFNFLMPELLGARAEFQRHFRLPIERNGDDLRMSALRERVAPFVLRRMKEQVAKELPEKTELLRPVELEGEQRDLYESIRLAAHSDVRKALRNKGLTGSAIAILDALMKLRQVCCDPRLVKLPAARSVTQSAKRSLFFQLISAQLREGRRVLVFSQFVQMLTLLSEGLLERGIRHVTLTGQVPDRQRRIDAFQNGDVEVFLISLKAGGTGLNLTRADTVIHYDPWWNAAVQAQANDRAHRIGQLRPVFVHSLIASGSVEERMLSLQRRKRWLSDSLFGTDERGDRPRLELAEIEHLFAPLDG